MLEPASRARLLDEPSEEHDPAAGVGEGISSGAPDGERRAEHCSIEVPSDASSLGLRYRSIEGREREKKRCRASCSWNDFISTPALAFILLAVVIGVIAVYSFTYGRTTAPDRDYVSDDDTNTPSDDVKVTPAAPPPVPPGKLGRRGAWYYPRGENATTIGGLVESLDLDFLVVSCGSQHLEDQRKALTGSDGNGTTDPLVELMNEVRDYLATSSNRSLDIVLMTLQGPKFTFESNLNASMANVAKALDLCSQIGCTQLHFDIEPHVLPEWNEGENEEQKDANRVELLTQLTVVQKTARDAIESSNPELGVSMAMTWWYPTQAYLNETLTGLSLSVDYIYIMSYGGLGGTAEQVLQMVGKRVQNPGMDSQPFYAGIGVEGFGSTEAAIEGAAQVAKTLEDEKTFLGVCFYSLNSFVQA